MTKKQPSLKKQSKSERARRNLLIATKKAVFFRERGELVKSRKIFKRIIKKAKVLKNSINKTDQNKYVEIMGEWIIQLRHEGKYSLNLALSEAMSVYNYSRNKQLGNPKAIRGVSNTMMNLEGYEFAQSYLKEMLELLTKNDSARVGDTLGHLAHSLFRSGKVAEAEKMIVEAIEKIDLNSGNSSDLEVAVWRTQAMMVQALILNLEGRLSEAIKMVDEAFKIAKKNKLSARIDQTKWLASYLKHEKK